MIMEKDENKLQPPTGYASWLDYAIATMDASGAFSERMFDGDMPTQDQIREAAQAELDQLADTATEAADRASAAIDDSLTFIQESNQRIAAMENASQDGNLASTVLSRMGERSRAIEVDIDTGLPVTKI